MKEKGLNIGLFLNVWSILAIISTIGAIILLSTMFDIKIPLLDADIILNFMDDYIDFEIIIIALFFSLIASPFFWLQALFYYPSQKIEKQEAKKRDEKKKVQEAEAKNLQAKLDNIVKEHSFDKTCKD